MKRSLILSTLLALAGAATFLAMPAKAAPFVCLSDHPIDGQSIPGSVQVPDDNNCEIHDSTIGGSITLGSGSSMQIGTSSVGGSINAVNNPRWLRIGSEDPTRIGANVNIT